MFNHTLLGELFCETGLAAKNLTRAWKQSYTAAIIFRYLCRIFHVKEKKKKAKTAISNNSPIVRF